MPTFEVEQTPDGKMVLVPFGNEENNSGADQLQSLFRKKPAKESSEMVENPSAAKVVAAKPLDINSLPDSYNALLSVFKYLPRQDLVRAGGVCKFWRQVLYKYDIIRHNPATSAKVSRSRVARQSHNLLTNYYIGYHCKFVPNYT